MKRTAALSLVALVLLLTLLPCAGVGASSQIIASEGFDSGKGDVGGNLVLSWRSTGGVGNKGGLHVRQTRDLEDLTNLPGKMLKGNRYRVSAWVKPDGNTLSANTIHFIYRTKTKTGKNGYLMIGAKTENINDGKWHYVEAIFSYDGVLNVVGQPSENGDENAASRFDLRIGNGYISQSSGEDMRYFLDEYELALLPSDDDVIPDGDERIDIQIDSDLWTEDAEYVSGSVSVENMKEDADLVSALALYDVGNHLIDLTTETKSLSAGGGDSWSTALLNDSRASYAKLILCEAKTLKPLTKNVTAYKLPAASYVYVDPTTKNSTGDGTARNPYKTVEDAKNRVREMLPDAQDDIHVMLRGGTYDIKSPLRFGSEDCSDTVSVIYSACRNEKVVFSGGTKVRGFELYDSSKNIYRVWLGSGLKSRQFFVNGVRAVRARSGAGLQDGEYLGESGLATSDTSFLQYKNISDLEMVFYSLWTNPRCQVASVRESGGRVIFKMDEPGWSTIINKGSSSVSAPPYYYENALELLDEEGEWYLDSKGGYLYYKPRFFENIQKPEAVLPTAEKLVEVKGDSASRPVKNIAFENIEFSYTTWNRPSTTYGHSDAQNNHLRYSDIDDKLIDAAVELENAHNVDFNRCKFNRLGATGLKLTGAIQGCDITQNEFCDISGSAITLGEPDTSNVNVYNPANEELFITDNTIANNYIHKVAVDYKSASGLSVGFPKNTVIRNNEITDVPYSGMHIGYGWDGISTSGLQNVVIKNNYIHNVLNDNVSDGGAIYTNGPTGGTTGNYNKITENYIEDMRCTGASLYTDEGSSFWEISQNVVDLTSTPLWYVYGQSEPSLPKWLSVWTKSIDHNRYIDNYTTTSNASYKGGPNNVLQGTKVYQNADWPWEARRIIERSGIEPESEGYFTCRLQKIDTDTLVGLDIGDSTRLTLRGITGKDTAYRLNHASVYTKSSNEGVVSANGLDITAVGAGECNVTVAVVENGICLMRDITVSVS